MRKRLIWEAVLTCAVCLGCGAMAAVCVYFKHTLGVSAWLALGVSAALHVRRGRDTARVVKQMLTECEAQMLAEVERHTRDLEAAYRDALERHEREAGRALQ